MRVALPATIATEVLDTLGDMITSAHGYLGRDDFRVRRLEMDIDKLMKVDAANGHIAKAGMFQLFGDDQTARYHVSCAERLRSEPGVDATLTSILSNLGFFSEAQASFRAAADPRRNEYSNSVRLGLSCGAFHSVCELMGQASRMGISTPDEVAVLARSAHSVLEAGQVADEQVGAVLDVAGELMRSERVFFVGVGPEILAIDDADIGHCVYLVLSLPLPPDRVADLQFELVDRLVDRFPVLPSALSVGFRSADV